MTQPERADVAALQEYSGQLQERLHRMMSEGPRLAEQARAVQATETSDDGLVSVTVGPRGELVRLDLDPRIYRRPDSRQLADTITATVQRATRAAEERVVQLLAPVVDSDQLRATLSGDTEALTAIMSEQLRGGR
jgi:DNA-binding protein YbaB